MIEQEVIAKAKDAMRTRILAERSRLSAEHRARGEAAILHGGGKLPGLRAGAVVAGYAAIRDEADPAGLIALLHERGHPIALPVVVARATPLEFRSWTPGTPLEKGVFGVPIPGVHADRLVPQIVLVPLAAFDREGYRLGYGAGFYDRTIAGLRSRGEVVTIGIAFDEQEVEAVPHDEYDQRLDWMLTPSGIFSTGLGQGD